MVMGGPLPHVIAAKCIAFKEAKTADFSKYAHRVVENAQALAKALQKHNLPVLTKGTDNHMVIVDFSQSGLTGRQAENILRKAHITCNRNTIPNDKNGPWYTSGIRLGAQALTSLGADKKAMVVIAGIIAEAIQNAKPCINDNGTKSKTHCTIDDALFEKLRAKVEELLTRFPLYPEIELG